MRNQSVQVFYLRRVRVLGEVRDAGLYLVDPTMTLDDIIALAGGASERGNLNRVRLIRDGQTVEANLDVSRSVAATLHSGDQVYVPKTSWLSRNSAVLVGALISAVGAIVAFGI